MIIIHPHLRVDVLIKGCGHQLKAVDQKKIGYNLEAGQTFHRIKYINSNIECFFGFLFEIKEVNEDFIVLKIKNNYKEFETFKEVKLPFFKNIINYTGIEELNYLEITPCDDLFENIDIFDKEIVEKRAEDGERIFIWGSGGRRVYSGLEENLNNFVKLGQKTLTNY